MHKQFLIAVLCLVFLPLAAWAQTGKIAGKVTDRETGEPLIGANIVVEGTSRGAATNINGEFVILNVPIGKVTLVAKYIGYQTITIREILVKSNETTQRDFQLPSDAYKVPDVVINAERPLVDKNVTNSKSTVTQEDIQNLPVRGVESIVALKAGIVQQGGTIYVRGSRGDATGYVVDGVAVNDPVYGGRSLTVISNAIAEVNFQAGGYSAEFGGANGGLISTTTRSGGRQMQFGLEAFTDSWAKPGNQALGGYSYGFSRYTLTAGGPIAGAYRFFVAAENTFQRTPSAYRNAYTLTDKYSSALKNTAAWKLLSATEQAKNGIFDPQQGANAKVYDYTYPGGYILNDASQSSSLTGNLTADLNPITLRFGASYSRGDSRGGAGITTYLAQNRASQTQSENYSANLKMTHLLSPNTFYELYVNYFGNYGVTFDPDFKDNYFAYGDSISNAKLGYKYQAGDILPAAMGLYGASFYPSSYPIMSLASNYAKNRFNSISGKLNFVHQIGRTHEIKVGGDAQLYTVRQYSIDGTTLASFLRGNPDATEAQIATSSGTNNYGYDQWGKKIEDGLDGPKKPVFASFYGLDKIELEDLVINFGLRWDYINTASKEFVDPSNVLFTADGQIDQTDKNLKDTKASSTISPRIGFSFPVTDQTVFYAQYGKFVQQSRLRDLYVGSARIAYFLKAGYAFQNPVGYGLRPERTTQYDFGFRQQIGDFLAFDIGAFYKDIRDQIQQRQIAASPTANHNSYYAWVNGDFATTSGVSLRVDLRRVERVQASVDYTYSDARGTGSAPSDAFYAIWQSPTELPYFPKYVSPLSFDQTHRGSLNLDYRFGNDDGPMLGGVKFLERVGLNLLFTFNSGHPYTRADEYSYGNRRQPVEALNASHTPWNFQLDGRIDKTVSIANLDVNFYIWVINILDTKNVEDVFIQSGSASDNGYLSTEEGQTRINNYAQYGAIFQQLYRDFYYQTNIMNADLYGPPRQIRFGMRVDF